MLLFCFSMREKQKLQISYQVETEDEEMGWLDWFTTEDAVPQGKRGQLETDGAVRHDFSDGREGSTAVRHLHMVYLYAEDVDWTAVL